MFILYNGCAVKLHCLFFILWETVGLKHPFQANKKVPHASHTQNKYHVSFASADWPLSQKDLSCASAVTPKCFYFLALFSGCVLRFSNAHLLTAEEQRGMIFFFFQSVERGGEVG